MNKIAKTINIYLIAEMQRADLTHSFSYMTYIEDRKIKIIPTGIDTQFIDVSLAPEFVTANNEEEFLKIFGINLSANIELYGTENDDYHVVVDDLGQIVITLDVNLEDTNSYGEFVEVIENKDIDLVVEELDEETEEEIEEPNIESISAEVIEEDLDDEEGPEWKIVYELPINEDLEYESEKPANVEIITAPDAETAAKYAGQHARIMAKEDPKWSEAEIISIQKQQ